MMDDSRNTCCGMSHTVPSHRLDGAEWRVMSLQWIPSEGLGIVCAEGSPVTDVARTGVRPCRH